MNTLNDHACDVNIIKVIEKMTGLTGDHHGWDIKTSDEIEGHAYTRFVPLDWADFHIDVAIGPNSNYEIGGHYIKKKESGGLRRFIPLLLPFLQVNSNGWELLYNSLIEGIK